MHKKSVRIKFFFSVVFVLLFLAGESAQAVSYKPLKGWFWGGSRGGDSVATGLGWISASNSNGTGGNYSIKLPDSDGAVTGYAWSGNAGWIDFQPAGRTGVHRSGDILTGWARFGDIASEDPNNTDGWEGWIEFPDGSNVFNNDSGTISDGADSVSASGNTITFSSSTGGGSVDLTLKGIVSASGSGSIGGENDEKINCVKYQDPARIIFANSSNPTDCSSNPDTQQIIITVSGSSGVTGQGYTASFFDRFSASGITLTLEKTTGGRADVSVSVPGVKVITRSYGGIYPGSIKSEIGLSGYAWSAENPSRRDGFGYIFFPDNRADWVRYPAPEVRLTATPAQVLIGPNEGVPISNKVTLSWQVDGAAPGGCTADCFPDPSVCGWAGSKSTGGGNGAKVTLTGARTNFSLRCSNDPSFTNTSINVDIVCNKRVCENGACRLTSPSVSSWTDIDITDGKRQCREECTNNLQCQVFEWQEKAPN